MSKGTHLLADFWGVDAALLDSPDALRECLYRVARAGTCTVIGEMLHEFSPVGVTGVLVLAESHLSIHTWPQDGYCAIDAFTCGDTVNMPALEAALILELKPARSRIETRIRGVCE